MGFVDLWPSRMQGQFFYQSRARWTMVFGHVQMSKTVMKGCPCPHPPLKETSPISNPTMSMAPL